MRTVHTTVFLLIGLICLISSCSSSTTPKIEEASIPILDFPLSDEFDLKVDNYASFNLNGFHVLLSLDVIERSEEVSNNVLQTVYSDLLKIKGLNLNQPVKDQLKQVPIFISWNNAYSAAVYHPSPAWLEENGFDPKMGKAVEITNVTNFLEWRSLNQPFMVLHELAHAYHDQVLTFDYELILETYQNAESKGLYQNVPYHTGNGFYSTQERAYGLTNHIEFFAELTEAYFGLNDIYPYSRTQLADYDSTGYAMIQQSWAIIE